MFVHQEIQTKTTVDVLWQDGTRETIDVKQTVPYLNPDEYDCWCVYISTVTVVVVNA